MGFFSDFTYKIKKSYYKILYLCFGCKEKIDSFEWQVDKLLMYNDLIRNKYLLEMFTYIKDKNYVFFIDGDITDKKKI